MSQKPPQPIRRGIGELIYQTILDHPDLAGYDLSTCTAPAASRPAPWARK